MAIVITALVSIGLYALTLALERLALPWYHSAQRAQHWEDGGIY